MQPANATGYLLQHVAGVAYRQADQILQERLGIGLSQYRILMMLQVKPVCDQRRLADYLGQTEASISRQVKLLLDKGLLAIHIDPHERRRHIMTPTDRGVQITEAAREILAEYYQQTLVQLSDKQKMDLETMLTTLHDHVCAPGRPMACDHPFDELIANSK